MKTKFPLCFLTLTAVCDESSGVGLAQDEPMPERVDVALFEKAEKALKEAGYDEKLVWKYGYQVGSGFEPGETEFTFFERVEGVGEAPADANRELIVLPVEYPQAVIDLVEAWF